MLSGNKYDIGSNITRAREFAYRVLNNNFSNTTKEDYFLFQISKFLLLKESMIKKDSNKNTIYFNYDENGKYFKAIKQIVDFVRKNGILVSNSLDVIIEPVIYNYNEALKSYIRDFHKIRDTFAHGAYKIDFENGNIILDNNNIPSDGKIGKNVYLIKCVLPISMLELFTFVASNPKNSYTEQEIQEYNNEIRKNRKRYGYKDNYDDKFIYEYNKLNLYNNLYNKEKDLYNNYTYNLDSEKYNNYTFNLESTKYNNNQYIYKSEKYYYDTLEVARKQESTLRLLINLLTSNRDLSKKQKVQLLKLLKKYGLIDYNIDLDKVLFIKKEKPDKSYVEKLAIVIDEISSILGMKSKEEDVIKVASIYNYMQLFLSFKLEEIKQFSGEKKKNLGQLKISTIHPTYSDNKNSQYNVKVTAINNYFEKIIIPKLNNKLEKYDNHKSEGFRKAINKNLEEYIDKIINDLADKNIEIITSLRNSLEHGNILENAGNIILNDQSNQRDENTINYVCYGTPNDFYEIIKNIELNEAHNNFTFDELLVELEQILKRETYVEFKNIIQKIQQINKEETLDFYGSK